MSHEQNARIAQQLLAAIASAADPDAIAQLFSDDLQFEIPGDTGALPWIGHKTGRAAVSAFIRDTRRLLEPLRFNVQAILADQERAIIIGDLASKVHATSKLIETSFAIILTISHGQITRFHMLEDSFAVSRAARP